jgi:DNA invertase Pin-like site-specific DNA recombinase
MRAVGYTRVSTREQGDSGLGLAAQRGAIEAECERKGWVIVELHEDVQSGKSADDRQGLQQALVGLQGGEADALVVSKLDRLGRSVFDVSGLLRRAEREGWSIVALDIGLDTTTIMGAAMAQMASVFAELERRRISERIRDAMAQLPRERRNGRPTYDEPTRARARALRESGLSLQRIAEALADEGVRPARGTALHATAIRSMLG